MSLTYYLNSSYCFITTCLLVQCLPSHLFDFDSTIAFCVADGTCNPYSNLHCLIGATCASPSDCIRTDAEFHGYEPPPAKAVVIFLVIALVVMASFIFCLWCCFAVWDRRRLKALKGRVEARRRAASEAGEDTTTGGMSRGRSGSINIGMKTIRRPPPTIVQLSNMSVSSSFRSGPDDSSSSSSSQPKITVTTKKKVVSSHGDDLGASLLEGKNDSSDQDRVTPKYSVNVNPDGTAELQQISASESPTATFVDRAAASEIPFPPPLPPLPHKQQLIRSGAKFCTVMGCLGTLIALIVVCLMYPHMPQYSLCNKDIQWYSILSNMVSFSPSVDVDLHLSVWNPNRFHMLLNRIDARILYGADIVGTGSVYNISFNAGSIDDFLLTVDFAPTLASATSMLKDHLKGKLLLDVLFDLDTSILISKFAQPVFQINTTYVFESIDAEGETERQYCKCVNPDVNAKQPTLQNRLDQNFIGQRFQPVLQTPKINAVTRFVPRPPATNNQDRSINNQPITPIVTDRSVEDEDTTGKEETTPPPSLI